MRKLLCLLTAVGVATASQASFTIATFADPAADASTPLFTYDMGASTLGGSWSGLNLDLDTPGLLGGGASTDVTFTMAPVTLTLLFGNVYTMSAGSVVFVDSSSNPLLTVSFTGGWFVNPFSASSADMIGYNVSYSGPNVPSGLFNESFSFSFANATTSGNTVTYTSAFTSSADVVPEPASMLVLGGAAAIAAIRRRRAR